MMNAVMTSGDVLMGFWQEAVEMVTTERQKHENEKRAQLAAAQELMREHVPADVLDALGLDVATAVWPAQSDAAAVSGSCVFEGERIETRVTASLRGFRGSEVSLSVDGKSVPMGEQVRARVGLALGQAVQARRNERKEASELLVRKAQQWGLTSTDLLSRNLRWDKLPHVAPAAVQEARRIVAGRKWAERKDAWARAHQRRAERAALEERCGLLIAAAAEWVELENEYHAACQAWAKGWTAQLEHDYGKPELWRVTYVPTSCDWRGARGEEEEINWTQQTVVMEAPEDLAEFRTLVPVTEVSPNGMVKDGVRLGAIVRMEPVTFEVWPRMDVAMPYCRSVKVGEFWVNVPPEATPIYAPAPAHLASSLEKGKPQRPHARFWDWLGERGFERAAEKLRWFEFDPAGIAAMDAERLAGLLS